MAFTDFGTSKKLKAEIKKREDEKLKYKKLLEQREKAIQSKRSSNISNLNKPMISPYLSQEQTMIDNLFGGGDRVIFNNPESQCKTNINGALMPNTMGDDFEDETASTFGYGRNKYRSGLF